MIIPAAKGMCSSAKYKFEMNNYTQQLKKRLFQQLGILLCVLTISTYNHRQKYAFPQPNSEKRHIGLSPTISK